jgi:hypothetical protein
MSPDQTEDLVTRVEQIEERLRILENHVSERDVLAEVLDRVSPEEDPELAGVRDAFIRIPEIQRKREESLRRAASRPSPAPKTPGSPDKPRDSRGGHVITNVLDHDR